MQKERIVAAFDFDGTITKKDTLFDFLKFYKGTPALLLGILFVSPYLLLYCLGIISNEQAKEKLLAYFIKGECSDTFKLRCQEYVPRINEICYDETIERIKWHQNQGHEVLIISASLRDWIEPWALTRGITTILATEIEKKEGVITGYFATKNCFGQEKVNRLKILYPTKNYLLYAYGDSSGDKELLGYSDFPKLYKRK